MKQELARKFAEAAVSSMIPVAGGPLAALCSVVIPEKGQIELEKWRKDVSDKLNDFEDAIRFISESISLSENAATLGRWMSEKSENAYSDSFDYESVEAQFPEASTTELLEAVGELEIADMIKLSHVLGKQFHSVWPLPKLYEVFDPIVFNVSPRDDAAVIAEKLLASEKSLSVEETARELGWEVRRINPALAIVGNFIAPGRESQPLDSTYVIRHMSLIPPVRAKLRKFVNEVRSGRDVPSQSH
ncbi:MAG: hypothetical protein GDA39_00510 [Hyphomonadaceae bacterium]|nr:hypothetical protein [Hyphomonadaceae bacterium]MBC6411504.1 hypothetical protein [Hyphomonadaceae bacterium]